MLLFFLISLLGGGINTISRINRYAQEAANAYAAENYVEAIAAYDYLLNDLKVEDNQLRVNLAHSYYRAGRLDLAKNEYRLLTDHRYRNIRAVALIQLGNIAASEKKFKRALSYFKDALITEPTNKSAQYNFELLKKYLDLHPEIAAAEEEESTPTPQRGTPPPAEALQEPQPQQRPASNGTDQQELENPQQDPSRQPEQRKGGSGQNEHSGEQEKEQNMGEERGEEQGLNLQSTENDQNSSQRSGGSESISEQDTQAQTQKSRLQRMNISPEKAQVLLDAMRNAELQYIQQLPKKSSSKPDPSKPDW